MKGPGLLNTANNANNKPIDARPAHKFSCGAAASSVRFLKCMTKGWPEVGILKNARRRGKETDGEPRYDTRVHTAEGMRENRTGRICINIRN